MEKETSRTTEEERLAKQIIERLKKEGILEAEMLIAANIDGGVDFYCGNIRDELTDSERATIFRTVDTMARRAGHIRGELTQTERKVSYVSYNPKGESQ